MIVSKGGTLRKFLDVCPSHVSGANISSLPLCCYYEELNERWCGGDFDNTKIFLVPAAPGLPAVMTVLLGAGVSLVQRGIPYDLEIGDM